MNDERLIVTQASEDTGEERQRQPGPDGQPEPAPAPAPEQQARAGKRRRRGPGPFTLLVLPGLVTVTGVATFLTLTGGLPSPWPEDSGAGQTAAAVIDPSYVPWLRKAASACTVLEPSVLAAQIDQLSGWTDDTDDLSGQKGIAAFTDSEWRTWGKDDDGNGNSSPRDPADAIMALGRRDCSLAGKMTDLRTEGRVSGDLVDLTLAAYASGPDAVTQAGRVPPAAKTYLAEVKALLPRYEALDRDDSGDGAGAAAGALLSPPVTPLTITSPFGSREHPLTGVTKLHTGVDFAAPQGAPAVAAREGRVVFAAPTTAYGNRVVIDHGTLEGKRLETTYSHLSSLEAAVGQTVEAGTLIGRVGSTGLSTGPHLHFEVVFDGYYADPRPWLVAGG
ncbi:M23 family metallopeptidase [Streptomyces lancefieldiae]|uniref:M23 family metallopeptidase n=1 Tax=Streptomyces lancefieldiae TaxID=3075520 RepID=A0ABU3AMS8_9ACTN|nr:M23 family metallopeptidase [Streptomyces sp. DSM 40712]MDT0611175.1 M23 family metallopeptidase [Streptomyces sp. DSM 40712]